MNKNVSRWKRKGRAMAIRYANEPCPLRRCGLRRGLLRIVGDVDHSILSLDHLIWYVLTHTLALEASRMAWTMGYASTGPSFCRKPRCYKDMAASVKSRQPAPTDKVVEVQHSRSCHKRLAHIKESEPPYHRMIRIRLVNSGAFHLVWVAW